MHRKQATGALKNKNCKDETRINLIAYNLWERPGHDKQLKWAD